MGNLCALLRLGNDFEQLGLFSRLVLNEKWSAFDVIQFSLVSTHAQAWCLLRVSGASEREILALAQALPNTGTCDTQGKKCYENIHEIFGPRNAPLWWFNTRHNTGIHELQFHCRSFTIAEFTMHLPLVHDERRYSATTRHGAAHFPLLDVAVREALRPKLPPPQLCTATARMQGLKRRHAEEEDQGEERAAKRLRVQ